MTPEEPEQPNPETRPGFTSPGGPAGSEPGSESTPSTPTQAGEEAIPYVDPIPPSDIPLEDRNTAMLAHICGIFASFIVPLVIYLVKKDDEADFVIGEAKESLNFQITLILISLGVGIFATVTCGFGALLGLPLMVWAIVMPIIAGMKAKEGIAYQYPFTLRLVT